MKKISLLSLTVLVITFLLTAGVSGNGESSLNQEYDLVGKRSIEPQFYHMERVIVVRADDGTRQSVVTINVPTPQGTWFMGVTTNTFTSAATLAQQA